MSYDIDKYLTKAYEGEQLNEQAIKIVCMKLKEIISNEPNVKRIQKPVTIVGDVHGYLNSKFYSQLTV